jgi:hypothetical protein
MSKKYVPLAPGDLVISRHPQSFTFYSDMGEDDGHVAGVNLTPNSDHKQRPIHALVLAVGVIPWGGFDKRLFCPADDSLDDKTHGRIFKVCLMIPNIGIGWSWSDQWEKQ